MTENNSNKEIYVDVKNLTKGFNGNVVLDGVDITLGEAENVVVLGKSGVGKSVLIKVIVGLIQPDNFDKLTIFEKTVPDLEEDDLNELRARIGFLFQGGALYDSMTVRENLEFPVRRHESSKDRDALDEMTHEALKNVGLENAIDKYPEELSGGMKKRIALARALILKPKIIMYDEPTTGLDPGTSKEISRLMLDVQEKYQTSALVVTHDMVCAKTVGNRLLVLHDGNFVAEGTYDELQQSDKEQVRSFFE